MGREWKVNVAEYARLRIGRPGHVRHDPVPLNPLAKVLLKKGLPRLLR